ncbi:MAG: cyclic nucleotide-binding domain-containing protein [Verrucomicrobiota bacterium]
MMDPASTSQLPATGILAGLSAEELARFASLGEFLKVSPGEVIIREGKDQNWLYVIIEGRLNVTKENLKEPLAEIGPGESIGEVNLFDPGVASATVFAPVPGEIWRVNREGLNQFLNSGGPEVPLLVGLLTEVSQRIRATNQRLQDAQIQKTDKVRNYEGWIG